MDVEERLRYINDVISKLDFCVQSFYKLKRDGDVPRNYSTPELNLLPQIKNRAYTLTYQFQNGAMSKRAVSKELNSLEEGLRGMIVALHYALVSNRFFGLTGKELGKILPSRYTRGRDLLARMDKAIVHLKNYGNGEVLRAEKTAPLPMLSARYMKALNDYFTAIKELKTYLFQEIKSELKRSIDLIRSAGLSKDLLKNEENIVKWGTKSSIKEVVMYKDFRKLINILNSCYKERTRSLEVKRKLIAKAEKLLRQVEGVVGGVDIERDKLKRMAPQYVNYSVYQARYIKSLWSLKPNRIKKIMEEIKKELNLIKDYQRKEVESIKARIPPLLSVCKRHGYSKIYAALKEIYKVNTKQLSKRDFIRATTTYDRVLVALSNALSTKLNSFKAEMMAERERIETYSIDAGLKEALAKEISRPIEGIKKGYERVKMARSTEEMVVLIDKLIQKAQGFMAQWEEKTREILEQEAVKSKVRGQISKWLVSAGVGEDSINDRMTKAMYPVWRQYLEIVGDAAITQLEEDLKKHIARLEENLKMFGGIGTELTQNVAEGGGDEGRARAQDLHMTILALKAEEENLEALKSKVNALINEINTRSKFICLDMVTKGPSPEVDSEIKRLLMDIQVGREENSQELSNISKRVEVVLASSEVKDFLTDIRYTPWLVYDRGTFRLFMRLENAYDGTLKDVKISVIIPADKGRLREVESGVVDIGTMGEKDVKHVTMVIEPIEGGEFIPVEMVVTYVYPSGAEGKGKLPPYTIDLKRLVVSPKVMSIEKALEMVKNIGQDNGHFTGFFVTAKDISIAYEIIQDNFRNMHLVASEEFPTDDGKAATIFWYACERKADGKVYLFVVVSRPNPITPTIDVGIVGYSDIMEDLKIYTKQLLNTIQCSINFGESGRKVTIIDEERSRLIIQPILQSAIALAMEAEKTGEFVTFETTEMVDGTGGSSDGVEMSDATIVGNKSEDSPEVGSVEWIHVEEGDNEPTPDAQVGEIEDRDYIDDWVREWGSIYLLETGDENRVYEVFLDFMEGGNGGMIITRTHPDKIKKRYPRVKALPTLWLSKTPGPNCVSPTNIGKIASLIKEELNKKDHKVVLLDGLEYIINNNDFQRVFRWFEDISEMFIIHDSILIVSISPASFEKKELALLERNRKVLR